jgi:protocatechuate 3,4-dioxygenase beta subunit
MLLTRNRVWIRDTRSVLRDRETAGLGSQAPAQIAKNVGATPRSQLLVTKQALSLAVGGAFIASLLLLAGGVAAVNSPAACSGKRTPSDGDPPPPLPAGKYFEPGSPLRRNVRVGMTGVPLSLSGTVYDEKCHRVAQVLLDFFQADSRGRYDRREIRLHGHQFTGARGRYWVGTIVPGHYRGRAPHIHVRVEAPHGPVLATQLFLPATVHVYGMDIGRLNARDHTFRRAHGRLTVHVTRHTRHGYAATFDFVIALS